MDETNNQQLNDLLRDMDAYLTSHGLGAHQYNSVIEQYLTLSPLILNKMSPDECAEASYLLSQYALYLQREVNQKKSVLQWCDRNLDKLTLPILNQYGDSYVKFEQKRMCAIMENPVAIELASIRGKVLNQLTTIEDMPYRVEKMSDRLSALSVTRRRKYES